MDVDTRVLRYFVAVAEQLSFTHAAETLFVSQSALSRQIQRLETDLRTPLFERTSREVRLTAAGESLLTVARGLIDSWEVAQQALREIAAAESQILRIGFEATGAGALGTHARTAFTKRHPAATIEPKRLDWGGEAAALRAGVVDVAFLWMPTDTTGLSVEIVATEQRIVGLATSHPLAQRRTIGIMDLRDQPLMWTRKAPKEWVDWWAVNPRPDGSEPLWGPENDNVEEMLEHVAAGTAVCISPQSMGSYYARPDLVWRPITDIPPLRIAVAWPATATNPLVAALVDVVRGLRPVHSDR
ncbi:LysR family transcriptional regulator [Nocardia goodfellowii]